ncbi:hypothetical protein LJR098_003620 [Rhizobium sp. LjRoot98]|uniref:hypothetical protein n=1 Tax=unclassified Rhizobium TaxID=2613769 RepID=UPI000715CB24|nr:hypothetical protein [Rhizobium sp. Root1204]KQV31648.1 hypothetical protein ASC96_31245 [Rhizobium sp. Root1204]
MDDTKGGAFVVVGVRESRMQGEGKQEDDRIAKTEEWSVDMDHRTDKVWVLGIQSKLYQWSKANPDDQWRDMWGWLTDLDFSDFYADPVRQEMMRLKRGGQIRRDVDPTPYYPIAPVYK